MDFMDMIRGNIKKNMNRETTKILYKIIESYNLMTFSTFIDNKETYNEALANGRQAVKEMNKRLKLSDQFSKTLLSYLTFLDNCAERGIYLPV
ncbi:MAG: hypothetical protein OXF85_01275 [Candidatus Saccharibacteria bacterium]|nr:hypothetical protein [Candidatus Saccharibacteria bacterium]